jgi:hypothetical protein
VLGALCADPARLVAMREAVPAPQDCTLAALEHARRTVAFYETALALGVPPVAARDPREEARADRRRRDHDAACRRGGAIPSR